MNTVTGSWVQLFSHCFLKSDSQNIKRNIPGEVDAVESFLTGSCQRDLNLCWLFPPGEEESRLWRLLSGAPLFNQTIVEGPHTGSHSYQQRALSS